jgi:DNA-binding NtrC family response regulator
MRVAEKSRQGMDVEKTVVVVDPDNKHCKELCSVLERETYRVLSVPSTKDLSRFLRKASACALILDIDLIPMDNQALKELRRGNRDLCIIGLSGRRFHPELKEALSHYIDACFAKPVEWDDLLYYLRGALNHAVKREPPPEETERVV